jgi:uncharacterized protein (DUF1800 family)
MTLTKSTRELAEEFYLPALRERMKRQAAPAAEPASNPVIVKPSAEDAARIRAERLPLAELTEQKILRAVYSERQLEEVLVDFWFNHFNVFSGKGLVRLYLTAYERDVVRPHVLGSFRDLLGAVAESPAMLLYLDNWQSVAPPGAVTTLELADAHRRQGRLRAAQPRPLFARPVRQAPQPRRRGLNENYARELMELHTLGVDGGYTQQDIREVARAFTGWTVDQPRGGGAFRFDPGSYDDGEKLVMGRRLPAGGGKRDGEVVLDLLARHPSTARFIATKLVRRFVADEPPASLVTLAAARFTRTNGDIEAVVRTILTSPEFLAPQAYRAKTKSPFEFVVSSLRAAEAVVETAVPLARTLQELGMPLYGAQPPTGYEDHASAWIGTGALLDRINFAVALAGGRVRGLQIGAATNHDVLPGLPARALGNDISRGTSEALAGENDDRRAMALLLGSPEFQKR